MGADGQRWVLGIDELDGSRADEVGGKGAQLGALRRLEGARVPEGFCVTTDAYRRWRALSGAPCRRRSPRRSSKRSPAWVRARRAMPPERDGQRIRVHGSVGWAELLD